MSNLIWENGDLTNGDVEIPDLVMLFGPYVTVIKSLVIDGKTIATYTKNMPAALAVEEVLRSPTNDGVHVNRARIVGMKGKWDMSGSAPYYNLWAIVKIEDD